MKILIDEILNILLLVLIGLELLMQTITRLRVATPSCLTGPCWSPDY